jgi:hypothetical protein
MGEAIKKCLKEKPNQKGGVTVIAKRIKAQSTLEYALLIAVVIGSLLYMQNYLKRSMQGRLQRIGDQMGEQYSPGNTYRNVASRTFITKTQTDELRGINSTKTDDTTGADQSRNEIRRLKDLKDEEWID